MAKAINIAFCAKTIYIYIPVVIYNFLFFLRRLKTNHMMELQKHAYILELGMVTNTNVCLNWAICFFYIFKSEVEVDETSLFEWAFQFPPRLLLSLSLSV
jgi:hypothetical protein